MSMYGDYIREHHGDEIMENDRGFATYRYLNDGKTVYIVDIYIRPDFRMSYAASQLADAIVAEAKIFGSVELLGTVAPKAKNTTNSLRFLLAYGMILASATPDLIVFRKDI